MTKVKKHITLFFLLGTIAFSYSAQSPFYTFLNGWRGVGVTEVNGNIYGVSNYQNSTNIGGVGGLKVDCINSNGIITNTWDLKNDSAKLEDANPLGYGIASFNDYGNWIGSNYFIYATGNTYSNIYRFNSSFDTVDKSIIIPRSNSILTNGGLKNVKHINDSVIILVMDDYNSSVGKYLKIKSIDTSGNLNWQTDITSLQPSIGAFMNSVQISTASDGGYFISCIDRPDLPNIGNDNIYYLLVKLDKNGTLQWKKRITDGVHTTNAGSIIQKDSNSYLVTWADSWLIEYPNWVIGERKGLDSASVWMGEIDLLGNFKWKKSLYKTAVNCDTLKNSDSYFSYNTIKLNDGDYLLCVDHFINDAVYIKVSPEGEVIWNRKIHLLEEENVDAPYSHTNIKYTKESLDGGILGVGEYSSDPSLLFPNGIRTSVLIKLDKYGCLEPNCHLEGCTDMEALNYNPEAVYDCGCMYDPCPTGNQITIDVRHFKDLSLIDFELYKTSNPNSNIIKLDGSIINNEEYYKQSICVDNDCNEGYALHINYHRTIAPNSELPFETNNPYGLGYYAYYHVYVNDSLVLDIGETIFSQRDTTIYFSFCISDTTTYIEQFNLYPNPTKNNFTIEIPIEVDLEEVTTLKIYDLLGKEVLQQNIFNNQTTISLENLSLGIYTAIIYQNKKLLFTKKILKQ
jgi:hypothetical protein